MHQRGFPTNQKSGRPHVTLSFTEAPLMRLSVGSLRQVVKRDLPIEFVPQQLTSYGGLELLHRYVRRLGLYPRLRRACADLGGDYGGARLSLLLLALFYGGGGARGTLEKESARSRPHRLTNYTRDEAGRSQPPHTPLSSRASPPHTCTNHATT